MQSSTASKIPTIVTHFLCATAEVKVNCFHKKSLYITLGLESMSCENETGATKKNFVNDFLGQLFQTSIGNSRLEINAFLFCPVNLICKAPLMDSGHPIRYLSHALHLGRLRFSWPLSALLATWHPFDGLPALTALLTIWRPHGRSTPSWLLHAMLATPRPPVTWRLPAAQFPPH